MPFNNIIFKNQTKEDQDAAGISPGDGQIALKGPFIDFDLEKGKLLCHAGGSPGLLLTRPSPAPNDDM